MTPQISWREYSTMTYLFANGFLSLLNLFLRAFNNKRICISLYGSYAFANNDCILTISSCDDVSFRCFCPCINADLSEVISFYTRKITFASVITHDWIVINHHWLLVKNRNVSIIDYFFNIFSKESLELIKSLYFEAFLFHCFSYHNDYIFSK